MTAKDFTELIAWRRADELERFVQEIIKRPILARDRDYCAQAADAAASAPRNIAEGFGRFAPIQFANFLRIAIGSEVETKNQILKAWQKARSRMTNTGREWCSVSALLAQPLD